MYPIHSPVINPPGTLIHLGPLGQALETALQTFVTTPNGLIVPNISADWRSITATNPSSRDAAILLTSTRRLNDPATMLAATYRELEHRTSPDSTARISFAGGEAIIDSERRKEMEMKQPLRVPGPHGAVPPSRWYLAVYRRGKFDGNAFVNEDGRSIHLHTVTGLTAIMGYGSLHSMHYLEYKLDNPQGRSLALFFKEDETRLDFTFLWFLNLVKSMFQFYQDSFKESLGGGFRIAGFDKNGSRAAYQAKGIDEPALNQFHKNLDCTKGFTLESEALVSGRRDSLVKDIHPAVPQASLRFATEDGQKRIYRTYYRPERSAVAWETGLSDETRRKISLRPAPQKP